MKKLLTLLILSFILSACHGHRFADCSRELIKVGECPLDYPEPPTQR